MYMLGTMYVLFDIKTVDVDIHTHDDKTWVQSVLFDKCDVVKPTCTHANHRGYTGQL